jgi:hypothetical protein
MLLCVVKGLFAGGAGSPVMGHSGEGRLLLGHAVPAVWGGDETADRSEDNVGVRAFWGRSRHRDLFSAGVLGRFRGRRNA